MTDERDDEPREDAAFTDELDLEAESEAGPQAEADGMPEAPAAAPTPEELLRLERDELHDRWLRLLAEMDNLRKRTRREVTDARRFAAADLLRAILEIQDNVERALHATDQVTGDQETPASVAALRQGVELIAQSFRQVLQDRGVEEIPAAGQPFDPALHEAVGQAPGGEDAETGTVLHVVQKGYMIDGLVLRPSRVILVQ